jgi:hypothetical protein
MATPEPSTVWILGAGFSRALGAPLFKDLFRSDHLVRAACERFQPKELLNLEKCISEALFCYRRHTPQDLGVGGGGDAGMFWRDPEEFLDVVESATSGVLSAMDLLATDPNADVASLAAMGRRALAIECSHFLRGANVAGTERWLPYRTWARRLTAADTVLTFNYDRVPDLLGLQNNANLQIIVPNASAENALSEARSLGAAPVLKLHGSVDWVAANGKIAVDTAEDLPLTSRGGDLVLAVPGPDKIGLRDKHKPFRYLWREGKNAINTATRIVVIGYRFPPTDASARVEILSAIKEACQAGTLTKVQVVLGPGLSDPDVVRMGQLLRFVCRQPTVVQMLPLFAEDFLAMPTEWMS